jgi:hypothetical protein
LFPIPPALSYAATGSRSRSIASSDFAGKEWRDRNLDRHYAGSPQKARIRCAIIRDPADVRGPVRPAESKRSSAAAGKGDRSPAGKWLELLSEIAPGLKRAAIMFNPDTSPASAYMPSVETPARSLKVAPVSASVHSDVSDVEIETPVADSANQPTSAKIASLSATKLRVWL